MSQVTVYSGVERRRWWSDEQKRALIEAAFAPDAVVAEVARAADVRPSQIYRWRRDLCGTGHVNVGFARDYRKFRVLGGLEGKKEPYYVTTQSPIGIQ